MKKNKFMETRIGKLVCMIAVMFLAVVTVMSGQVRLSAHAETANEFDKTDVLEDLEAATIDDKAFSLEDYAFNEKEQTAVLLLAEYCYSFYENKQGNYGLYLYVWNREGSRSTRRRRGTRRSCRLGMARNTVNIRCGI